MKTLLPVLLLCLLLDCKKDAADTIIPIKGFLLRDQYGQEMGTVGDPADDWQLRPWSLLGLLEQAFLSFSDTVGVDMQVRAFPNPVNQASRLQFQASKSMKLKLALVNEKGQVLRTYASRFSGTFYIMVDVADRTLFPSGAALRYYYSFSVDGAPHYKAGYGDIKICDAPVTNVYQCF